MEIGDASISAEVLQYNPKILGDAGVATPMIGPGPHGKRVAIACNDWLAISSQSKNPDAAWKFIAFVTQPKYLGEYDQTNGEIPTNKIAVKAAWVQRNPIYRQFTESVFPYAVAHPFYPHMPEMRDKVGAEIEKAAYGKESAEQAMKAAEDEANTVLAGVSTH
jgi:multiple sugar transport system substrate-binding protein